MKTLGGLAELGELNDLTRGPARCELLGALPRDEVSYLAIPGFATLETSGTLWQ
jgi:hypothetical protein